MVENAPENAWMSYIAYSVIGLETNPSDLAYHTCTRLQAPRPLVDVASRRPAKCILDFIDALSAMLNVARPHRG